MNKERLNYTPEVGCRFEVSFEDLSKGSEWYQVEMYTSSGETHLGRLQIIMSDEDKVPSIDVAGDFIRTEVRAYVWMGKWYFQYKIPDSAPMDGLSYLTNYLNGLHVEASLLRDLEDYIKRLTD